ncbi:hypothetical protein CA3LBN_000638 [Candidozyma haemuli]|uniref:Small nuclear ribonucleoprotein Sm D3 n=1 Tax=Candidozyma haemuli TaxID=45357 RepID=A0ABX8I3F6_9ASCO|nr:hypothetical protein CA3LBN_000638 [[Candida] haemuloni]
MSSGVPIKLLNEAQGHVVSLELTNGDTYRGKLQESEDNMNLSLGDVTITKGKTGETTYKGQVFVRGSMIRFVSPGEKPKPPVRGPPPKRTKH